MIFALNEDPLMFPKPALAEPDGLLAVGGDLSVARLQKAYSLGIFPWYEGEPICWYSPHERWVIFPEKVHVSHSMKKVLRKSDFQITYNQAFEQVINHCASVPRKDQDGTWIEPEMIAAYTRLFKAGIAKSVEVWHKEQLVGGMYGVEMNHVFCGESMFSLKPNASKIALITLCQSNKYKLIDAQIPNDHTKSLGAEMISRKEFERFLNMK